MTAEVDQDAFVRVCSVEEVPEGTARAVEVEGDPVAVVHACGEFFAIQDICSHADVPLSEGDVEGCTLECWLHGSQFDLRTGRPTSLPATRPVPVYRVKVADGAVHVNIHATPEPAQEPEQ